MTDQEKVEKYEQALRQIKYARGDEGVPPPFRALELVGRICLIAEKALPRETSDQEQFYDALLALIKQEHLRRGCSIHDLLNEVDARLCDYADEVLGIDTRGPSDE